MKNLSIFLIILLLYSCDRRKCNTTVTLTNNEVIKAQYVQNFVSGVSNIKKCDGDDIQVNTNNIKEVVEN
jgi:hypothetical protein